MRGAQKVRGLDRLSPRWRPRPKPGAVARTVAIGVVSLLAPAVSSCGGGGTSSTTNAASYSTLVDAGTHLLHSGNIGAAQQLFQQAIAKNPRPAVGHYDLGVVYEQEGQLRAAVRQYNLALSADRRYVPALFNQAVIVGRRDAPLAIFYYRQILRIKPNSPTALLNLGLLEAQSKPLHTRALHDLALALKFQPSLRSRLPESLQHQLRAAGG